MEPQGREGATRYRVMGIPGFGDLGVCAAELTEDQEDPYTIFDHGSRLPMGHSLLDIQALSYGGGLPPTHQVIIYEFIHVCVIKFIFVVSNSVLFYQFFILGSFYSNLYLSSRSKFSFLLKTKKCMFSFW